MNARELPIPEPCPASWDAMAGDDRTRFCRGCKKTVTDLSAMTDAESRAFLAENPTACIRYSANRRTGAVLHRACGPTGRRMARERVLRLATVTAALWTAGTAFASASPAGEPQDGPGWLEWLGQQVGALVVGGDAAVEDPEPVILMGAPPPPPVVTEPDEPTSIIPEATEPPVIPEVVAPPEEEEAPPVMGRFAALPPPVVR